MDNHSEKKPEESRVCKVGEEWVREAVRKKCTDVHRKCSVVEVESNW